MNRRIGIVALTAAGILAISRLSAHEGHEHGKADKSDVTIQGEVLDMACYMSGEAKGPKHQECALKCVKEGAPMGLLTKDGKVYLLVEDHASPKAYAQTKDWAGSQVTIKGDKAAHGGLTAIIVESAEKAK